MIFVRAPMARVQRADAVNVPADPLTPKTGTFDRGTPS